MVNEIIRRKMTAIKNSERTINIEAENALIDATSQLRSLGYDRREIAKMALVILGMTSCKIKEGRDDEPRDAKI
ncbi:MAG TPA: hypothetical protein PLV82_03620 [bacterium]|nr:hypothetical protein [bacterium]